jgi:6-phosphogluconate dehydrogenase
MAPDDIIIDGGNSPYREAVDANERLKASGIHYVDVGTSGGVWGWSAATA